MKPHHHTDVTSSVAEHQQDVLPRTLLESMATSFTEKASREITPKSKLQMQVFEHLKNNQSHSVAFLLLLVKARLLLKKDNIDVLIWKIFKCN